MGYGYSSSWETAKLSDNNSSGVGGMSHVAEILTLFQLVIYFSLSHVFFGLCGLAYSTQ